MNNSDCRRLIETISYITDKSARMVGEAGKLFTYDGQAREAPIRNIRQQLQDVRDLTHEIEQHLDEAEDNLE